MTFEPLAQRRHDSIDGVPEPAENPMLMGHEGAARSIAAAFAAGRLHHALLLTGPSGIGKATFAFHVARHVLAGTEGSGADGLQRADPDSRLFRAVAQGAHPGVLHLTRPENERGKGYKTVITVDEIRRLGRFLSLSAHDGGYRVVIVDPADDLNASAANALLKSLEEPPARTLFLLISHVPGRLVPTIRSRCQTIRLDPLSDAEVLEALSGLGLAVPEAETARAELARRAAGSVRAAILLTEYGGLEIATTIDNILGSTPFDLALAQRLADAVTSRDQAIQFDIFNDHLLDNLAAAASGDLGDKMRAGRRAEIWSRLREDIAVTDTYNLDKRHHVVSSLRRVHDSLHR
ncbi:MAG: DNA polymerase III subunit delta' [Rhizobiaceae bacterium]|nr:DNA polymerase III subunit delta' [Rhizobiaceae bacterium]